MSRNLNKETKLALEQSIAKWEGYATTTPMETCNLGRFNCPLCELFYDQNCAHCPVVDKGSSYCQNTPYTEACEAKSEWHRELIDRATKEKKFREIAQEEVDFLKSLLP